MKRSALYIITYLLLTTGAANALLIEMSGYEGIVIQDTESNQLWIHDLNTFNGLTYDGLIDAVADLDIGGYDWHVATEDEVGTLIRYSNDEILSAIGPTDFGRTSAVNFACFYDMDYNQQFAHLAYYFNDESWPGTSTIMDWGVVADTDINVGAWVTASARPTPEPMTLILFLVGFVGIIGKRKFS